MGGFDQENGYQDLTPAFSGSNRLRQGKSDHAPFFPGLTRVWASILSLRQFGFESREPWSKLFKPTASLIPQEVTMCVLEGA